MDNRRLLDSEELGAEKSKLRLSDVLFYHHFAEKKNWTHEKVELRSLLFLPVSTSLPAGTAVSPRRCRLAV